MAGKHRAVPRPPSRKRKPSVRPVPRQARAGSWDGVSMAARSFVACAATWRAVSPPSAARCAMSDSLSRRPPFPQRRHPTATPPARPSDAKQQSRPAPDTGHGPWYSRPTRRQPGRPCSAASRSGQCVTPHPSRPRSVDTPWHARLLTIMLQTTPPDPAALARRPDPAGPLAVATPTTRKLADASISVNTRRAYAGALRRLDAWRGAAPVDDASLAVYLGELFEAGRAPATAALAVAAVRFRAKLAGQPAPAGEATARVLGGYRRTAADRGRGQAAPLRADGLAAILATAERPRTDGRGVESHTTAHRRGRLDAVIASLLFMGGLRRSEVAAVCWADVTDARDGDGVLLTVRTSKTNQEGDAADVRYLKNGAAKAIRTLRAAAAAAPTDRVIGLSPLQIQRRFTAAARAAGIEARVTAHSGRVGLASELTARGASTTEVMLAGNWKTARMVAHYSAGATAERGAVRKYL